MGSGITSVHHYAPLNINEPPLREFDLDELFRYADKDVSAICSPAVSAFLRDAGQETGRKVAAHTLGLRVKTPKSGMGEVEGTADAAGRWTIRLDTGGHRRFAWASIVDSLPPFPAAE